MPMIGFTGLKGSGKDTAAVAFVEAGAVNLKFADGVKVMLRALLTYRGAPADLIDRMLEGDLKETPTHYLNSRTPRHAMQTLGTEWGRQMMDPEFWVAATMQAAGRQPQVVISDVRFENEVGAIAKAGGTVYRIVRPVEHPSSVDLHSSEAYIPFLPVDGEIVNDSPSADVFVAKVRDLLSA